MWHCRDPITYSINYSTVKVIWVRLRNYTQRVFAPKKKNEFDLLLWALKAWPHAKFIDSVQYADIFCFKSRWSAFSFGEQILRVWWNLKQHVYFTWVLFSSDKDIMINVTRRKFLFNRHTTWGICFFFINFWNIFSNNQF